MRTLTRMRKILFLDIDGVVNSEESFKKGTQRDHHGIDPYMAFLVGKIKLHTDCDVVLSSSWRGHEDNHKVIKQQVVDFVDITPRNGTGIRGTEIHSWLVKNIEPSVYRNYLDIEGHRIAILDDDSDMLLWQKDVFFKTSWKTGITEEIADAVIAHLNS